MLTALDALDPALEANSNIPLCTIKSPEITRAKAVEAENLISLAAKRF